MYLFHWSGFMFLKLIISVSTTGIKMFAEETAIFVPIAVYLEMVSPVKFI